MSGTKDDLLKCLHPCNKLEIAFYSSATFEAMIQGVWEEKDEGMISSPNELNSVSGLDMRRRISEYEHLGGVQRVTCMV